jgi:hypothetical protein
VRWTHRYRKSLNGLPKVCYVPATSAVLIAFFSSFFLLQTLTVLMKQTRQPVHSFKQYIYLDVYEWTLGKAFVSSLCNCKSYSRPQQLKHTFTLVVTMTEKLSVSHGQARKPGNTKGESITVPLTSCLTGLD